MSQSPYEIIDAYCKNNHKNDCIKDLAYSIYMKQYEGWTNKNIGDEAIKTILLADENIKSHVRSAEEKLNEEIEKEVKKIKKEFDKKSFFASIGTGILGNFAYSIILLIIFYLAKDQIATWLSSLTK